MGSCKKITIRSDIVTALKESLTNSLFMQEQGVGCKIKKDKTNKFLILYLGFTTFKMASHHNI